MDSKITQIDIDDEISLMKMPSIINGDFIELAKSGRFDVIINSCNCFCAMNMGMALRIKQNFKAAYIVDRGTRKGDPKKLGSYTYAYVDIHDKRLIVVNAYTQLNWRGKSNRTDYNAVRKVMESINCNFDGLRIGYTVFGIGAQGHGDWSIISSIISEELAGQDHSLVLEVS
jgi:hypothetical protein